MFSIMGIKYLITLIFILFCNTSIFSFKHYIKMANNNKKSKFSIISYEILKQNYCCILLFILEVLSM